jgi:hypothetical protein
MAEVRFTQDGKQYGYDPDKITTLEAIELKKMTSFTVTKWVEALQGGDAEAYRAFVWLARKRAGDTPEGRYSEFDFPLVDVLSSMEFDDEVEDPTPARTSKPRSRRTGR